MSTPGWSAAALAQAAAQAGWDSGTIAQAAAQVRCSADWTTCSDCGSQPALDAGLFTGSAPLQAAATATANGNAQVWVPVKADITPESSSASPMCCRLLPLLLQLLVSGRSWEMVCTALQHSLH